MIVAAAFRETQPRLGVVAGVMGAALLFLLWAMFRLQVVQAAQFSDREQAQSLRRIRIPAARGEIVDRHGAVLANNRPSFDVVIQLDQLQVSKRQDIWRVANSNFAELATLVGQPVTLTETEVRNHFRRRRPLPLTIWQDLTAPQVAVFEERVNDLPGIDLVATPVRQYPNGPLAAHVLGYLGRADLTQEDEFQDEEFSYFLPDMTGRTGLEKTFDECLRGTHGARSIRVNPGGRAVGQVAQRPAERGDRITLTLDARIQKIVEDALERAPLPAGKELRGAAVVLDPRNGAVLALSSMPMYDPNLFTPGTPAAELETVLQNPASPLLNRAIAGRYAPGSTFKPLTTLAILGAGISPHDVVNCEGSLKIGNRSFGCWNRRGHGQVDGAAALRWSCDVWFYQKGMATKLDPIAQIALDFGLGERTGLDLDGEKEGLVPTAEWKRQKLNEGWWDGDTAQLSMGQSFLLSTPLQMACVTMALANGGTLWRPYLVQRIESAAGLVISETRPEARRQLRLPPAHLEFVRDAMRAVVQAPDGTGRKAAIEGVTVAGKTGTAEFDEYVQGQRRRIKRTWFIAFAPDTAPEVAVAVMFEDGDSGGGTVAPVVGHILAGVFNTKVGSLISDRGVHAD